MCIFNKKFFFFENLSFSTKALLLQQQNIFSTKLFRYQHMFGILRIFSSFFYLHEHFSVDIFSTSFPTTILQFYESFPFTTKYWISIKHIPFLRTSIVLYETFSLLNKKIFIFTKNLEFFTKSYFLHFLPEFFFSKKNSAISTKNLLFYFTKLFHRQQKNLHFLEKLSLSHRKIIYIL